MEKVNLIKYLASVVSKVPKSHRLKLTVEIKSLQELIGSSDDLLADGRSKTWANGGSARAKVAARVASIPELKVYKVQWRGGNIIECSSIEAARIAKRSVKALGIVVSRRGKLHLTDGDDLVTIERLA